MSHAVETVRQPPAASTATVYDFICLFTHDLRRKQKRWQDGRLKFHTFNKRYMVYDDRGTLVGDGHWADAVAELCEGVEMEMDRGGAIVQVGEVVGEREQDLTEILDKRAREVERRREAAGKTPRHGPVGRAVVPQKSPFEERREGQRGTQAGKRRREVSPPSRMGHAQSLFGTRLSLVATVPMKMWRREESRVETSHAEDDRCRDSPEPLYSMPSKGLAGRDGWTKKGVNAAEGAAGDDETSVKTKAVASVPMRRREGESELGESRVETRRSPSISYVEDDRGKDSSPGSRARSHSTPSDVAAGRDGRTKKGVNTAEGAAEDNQTPVKTNKKKREGVEVDTRHIHRSVTGNNLGKSVVKACNDEAVMMSTSEEIVEHDEAVMMSTSEEIVEHDETPVKTKSKKKTKRTEVDTRHVRDAVTAGQLPPTKKIRTDDIAAGASLIASEYAKRTELRIKPRKKRGLLMVAEKAPALKEATPEPCSHRGESPRPATNPIDVIEVAESFTEPLPEPEPVITLDASESDEPVSRRQRKRAKAVPNASSSGSDGSQRRPTNSRAASPLLGSSDESDDKGPRRSRRNAKKALRDDLSVSAEESEGTAMPSRATKRRKSEPDEGGPRITKMARKSVKSKEIFGLAVSSDAIVGSLMSVSNQNLGPLGAETREKTPMMEEGQPVDEKAEGPPRPKITNPATRGRKAARKEDAAGQVPRCFVPFDPVIVKPRVICSSAQVDGPGPGAVAGTHVATKAAPVTGGPAGTALGFIRANGGAWSRHAEDLLGMGRPAGRISRH